MGIRSETWNEEAADLTWRRGSTRRDLAVDHRCCIRADVVAVTAVDASRLRRAEKHVVAASAPDSVVTDVGDLDWFGRRSRSRARCDGRWPRSDSPRRW